MPHRSTPSAGPKWALVAVVAVVLGGAVTAAVWWSRGDGPALHPGVPGDGPRTASSDDELRQLRAENQRLRDELASHTRVREHAGEVAAEAASDGGGDAVAATVDDPTPDNAALFAILIAELHDLEQTGALLKAYGDRPQWLADILMMAWMNTGQPERALALLQRLPPGTVSTGRVANLAQQLKERGNAGAGRDIVLAAMRVEPEDWSLVEAISELDPEAGLALMRELHGASPATGTDVDLSEFRLLLASQRGDELRAAVARLRQQPMPTDGSTPAWLEWLAEKQPALAVELFGKTVSDADHAAVAMQVARAMNLAGDHDGAKARLRDLLQSLPGDHPMNSDAFELLQEIDPQSALAIVDGRLQQAGTPELRAQRANLLVALQRPTEAIAEFLALQRAGWQGAARGLLNLDRRLALDAARAERDDEVLGDLADLAWNEGRHEEAQRLWQEASIIDPGDSEWTDNLRALRNGQDPMN